MKELGLPGAMVFSNVNGDAARRRPRTSRSGRRRNELGAVIYIHPAHPHDVEAMEEYWLMALVGFLFDTTLAAAHLVFAGVPERYPNITWVLTPHGRRDCRISPSGSIAATRRLPIAGATSRSRRREYLKQFYYDTVNFNPDAIEFAIKFAGADHILAGSDYPHQIGSIPKMKESLASLPVSDTERAGILGGNAARLLQL